MIQFSSIFKVELLTSKNLDPEMGKGILSAKCHELEVDKSNDISLAEPYWIGSEVADVFDKTKSPSEARKKYEKIQPALVYIVTWVPRREPVKSRGCYF